MAGKLDHHPIKPLIGSEVSGDPGDLASGVHGAELRRLLQERGVILFRDLDISPEQQRAITASIGPLRGAAGDELQRVTIDETASPEYSAYVAQTMFWHIDGYHNQTVPCFGGSFRPVKLSPSGGETEFLNCYAAYDALDSETKALIDPQRVVLSAQTSGKAAFPEASDAQFAAWRAVPPAQQPLVWQHCDGRKSLMLGVSVSHVADMAAADSYDLLLRLRAHQTRPEFVYSHQWRPGDLLIWNNTGTLHRARPFDPASGRLLNRFTIEGDEPICGVRG
ncbi:TauD/TfdA family dioxygenase [Novosphingobium sp. TH158]|uniref:TauD/TfdA dioxygenase family protein n=1 Tax=Novosphingobium sp. TH158 TaxID=2067455 RepID=UPI001303FBFB|nr:TauD/TfdA family dioxygenase [Novosphingobium sp. TH158]